MPPSELALSMSTAASLEFRRAKPGEEGAVIDVCRQALRWEDGDTDASFFRWKHTDNPFGQSPIWIAVERDTDGEPVVVGVRAMMRWDFRHADGRHRTMARAVDTATLPSHQGLGIFRGLTLAAVEAMTEEGTSAVFNTPNDQSRPGYLKMGWEKVGRIPIVVRPRSARSLLTIARSRVAGEKWGEPTEAGLPPSEALANPDAVERALAAQPAHAGWTTPLSVDYLRWRTGFGLLQCRIEPLGSSIADGFVVFRIRRRGPMRQLSVLHVVAERRDRARAAIGRLMAETRADLAMGSGRQLGVGDAMIPLPAAGPILTWRLLADSDRPTMDDLALELGTIELF